VILSERRTREVKSNDNCTANYCNLGEARLMHPALVMRHLGPAHIVASKTLEEGVTVLAKDFSA